MPTDSFAEDFEPEYLQNVQVDLNLATTEEINRAAKKKPRSRSR